MSEWEEMKPGWDLRQVKSGTKSGKAGDKFVKSDNVICAKTAVIPTIGSVACPLWLVWRSTGPRSWQNPVFCHGRPTQETCDKTAAASL